MTEILGVKEVREWFRTDVCKELRELRDDPAVVNRAHTPSPDSAALNQWIANHYIEADPEQLHYTDGKHDGGMDLVDISESAGELTFRVFQIAGSTIEALESGRLGFAKQKQADDIRKFRNNFGADAGQQAKNYRDFNSAAQLVTTRLRDAIRRCLETPTENHLTIEVFPISIKEVPEEGVRLIRELQVEADTKWSKERPSVTWKVHDLVGPTELMSRRFDRDKDSVPAQLRLFVKGEVARSYEQKGPHLCFTFARELIGDYYEKYGAGLFEANLRFFLGNKTPVNKIIKESCDSPTGIKWFHAYNNGIVVACTDCSDVKEERNPQGETRRYITLSYPQIINGGQTVVTLEGVLRELKGTLPEQMTEMERQRLKAIDELLLPTKIVVVQQGEAEGMDRIAIASNTQNALHERTMRSPSPESRSLKRALARGRYGWFAETKDGEWKAIYKHKDIIRKLTLHDRREFQWGEGINFARVVSNEDIGVSRLAFWGFVEDAKTSKVFKYEPDYFRRTFGHAPCSDGWAKLAERRWSWGDPALSQIFEAEQYGNAQSMLAYFTYRYWKAQALSDKDQKTAALEQALKRDPSTWSSYKQANGNWGEVSDASFADLTKDNPDCAYWVERVLNACYAVAVYQSMRIMYRTWGALTEEVCARALSTPELDGLYHGSQRPQELMDFRLSSARSGPLTAIGKIIHRAARKFVSEQFGAISLQRTPNIELLQVKWSSAFGLQVDDVLARLDRKEQIYWEAFEGENIAASQPASPSELLTLPVAGSAP